MALHTNLPIYKVAYQLLTMAAFLCANMPRNFKQLIGARILDECLKITTDVYRANVASDKVLHLDSLIQRLLEINVLFRLSMDSRLIAVDQYANVIELTASIGKQAGGWRRNSAAPVSHGQDHDD